MFSTSPFAVDAVTQLKMCYIFRQIFPFHSELRKDKIATWLRLPPAVFLSPPTFWEARDQPEPRSFLPRMKDPGKEVAKHERPRSLDHNRKLIDSYAEYSFKTDEVMTICEVGDQL